MRVAKRNLHKAHLLVASGRMRLMPPYPLKTIRHTISKCHPIKALPRGFWQLHFWYWVACAAAGSGFGALVSHLVLGWGLLLNVLGHRMGRSNHMYERWGGGWNTYSLLWSYIRCCYKPVFALFSTCNLFTQMHLHLNLTMQTWSKMIKHDVKFLHQYQMYQALSGGFVIYLYIHFPIAVAGAGAAPRQLEPHLARKTS